MRVIRSYTVAPESQTHLGGEVGRGGAFLREGGLGSSGLSVCGCSENLGGGEGSQMSLLVWLGGGDVAPADA